MSSKRHHLTDGTMSEAALSRAAVALAEQTGWRVFTIRNTKAAGLRSHSAEGFPDLLMLKGHRLIAAELKSRRGKATDAQHAWLKAFAEADAETYVWMPEHWSNGAIEAVLQGKNASTLQQRARERRSNGMAGRGHVPATHA